MKRLVVDLLDAEHHAIKMAAAERNMTMSRLILQAILYYLTRATRGPTQT